jgi:hypothetical protein
MKLTTIRSGSHLLSVDQGHAPARSEVTSCVFTVREGVSLLLLLYLVNCQDSDKVGRKFDRRTRISEDLSEIFSFLNFHSAESPDS